MIRVLDKKISENNYTLHFFFLKLTCKVHLFFYKGR